MQPTVVFDIDGTLTDYRGFIRKTAFPYFENKYGMKAVASDELEPEDIFGIKDRYIQEGLSEAIAEEKTKSLIDRFWISHRFVSYSLFGRYRKKSPSLLRTFRRMGFCVELHTSRAKSTEKKLVGCICRTFTILQCWLNGIFISPKRVIFHADDENKVSELIRIKPLLVFDDKPKVIKELIDCGIHVIRVCDMKEQPCADNTVCIDNFDPANVLEALNRLLGKRNWECIQREVKSDRFLEELSLLEHLSSLSTVR